MSNDISCENHDGRKFKGFYDPFIDVDKNGSLHTLGNEYWMDCFFFIPILWKKILYDEKSFSFLSFLAEKTKKYAFSRKS